MAPMLTGRAIRAMSSMCVSCRIAVMALYLAVVLNFAHFIMTSLYLAQSGLLLPIGEWRVVSVHRG